MNEAESAGRRLRPWTGTALLLWAVVMLCAFLAEGETPRPRRTVFNDDGQVIAEAPQENTSAFVRAWLDREADFVPFTTFVFLAATPDVCFYDTKAGERYGARFGEDFDKGWGRGLRRLRHEGTDPLRLAAEHMRAKGFEVLAAVRMNDTHHRSLDPGNPLCPQFATDHPEYVIRQPDGRTNETALDYSHAEVRAHRLAIMREIAEEYPVDGLDLNFVRWAKHFPRDQGREKAPVMTAYLGQIREMLDAAAAQRGRDRLTLGVRVPESLHACWLAGLDVRAWVEHGWVDYVVVSTWNNTDPQVPVGEFTAFAKPAGVQTLVAMGNMIGAIWDGPPVMFDRCVAMSAKHGPGYQGMLITEAEARAAAANYYAWGADGVAFWNVGIHFGAAKTAAPEQRERIRRWTSAVVDFACVNDGPRWYHYLPMGKGMSSRKPPARNYPWYDEGTSPLGQPNGPILTFPPDSLGKRRVFPFRMADGRNGEPLAGWLAFRVYHMTPEAHIEVDVNGRPVGSPQLERRDVDPRTQLTGVRFEIDLADCPAFRGENQLGLTLRRASEGDHVPYMEELEVFVE